MLRFTSTQERVLRQITSGDYSKSGCPAHLLNQRSLSVLMREGIVRGRILNSKRIIIAPDYYYRVLRILNKGKRAKDKETRLANMTEKDWILGLKDGKCWVWLESDYGKAEIWYNNDTYFLFSIPMYGGPASFEEAYPKRRIDDLIAKVESWT